MNKIGFIKINAIEILSLGYKVELFVPSSSSMSESFFITELQKYILFILPTAATTVLIFVYKLIDVKVDLYFSGGDK